MIDGENIFGGDQPQRVEDALNSKFKDKASNFEAILSYIGK